MGTSSPDLDVEEERACGGRRCSAPLEAARGEEGAVGALVLGGAGEPLGRRRQGVLLDTALSDDLACGDRVYIGSTGAYTTAYAAPFNGFDIPPVLCVTDPERTRQLDRSPTDTMRSPAIRAGSA